MEIRFIQQQMKTAVEIQKALNKVTHEEIVKAFVLYICYQYRKAWHLLNKEAKYSNI